MVLCCQRVMSKQLIANVFSKVFFFGFVIIFLFDSTATSCFGLGYEVYQTTF